MRTTQGATLLQYDDRCNILLAGGGLPAQLRPISAAQHYAQAVSGYLSVDENDNLVRNGKSGGQYLYVRVNEGKESVFVNLHPWTVTRRRVV